MAGTFSATSSWQNEKVKLTPEEQLREYEEQLKLDAKKKQLDAKYNPPAQPAPVSSPVNTTGDWTNSNPNYDYGTDLKTNEDYYTLAKDLSSKYLQDTLTLMDASSQYRSQEADQNTRNTDKLSRRQSYYDTRQYTSKTTDDMRRDEQAANYEMRNYSSKTTDDMRRDGQQQDFQKMLDKLRYDQESKMQDAQFQQDEEMFNLADQAKAREKQMNRQAASNLYNTSGMSPFYGGY